MCAIVHQNRLLLTVVFCLLFFPLKTQAQISGSISIDPTYYSTYSGVVNGGTISLPPGSFIDGNSYNILGNIVPISTTSGNFTINAGEVLAPGNSIGIYNVSGNYVQNPGSTLEVEVDRYGNSDLVNVTGTATINGGTVKVLPENNNYYTTFPNNTYTFLQAAGGVTGEFDSIDNRLPFFKTTLIYNPQSVQLQMVRDYAAPAQTANQRAVGNYLNDHLSGLTSITGRLDTLVTTPEQARNELDSLSGEAYGSLSTVGIENTGRFLQTIAERLRSRSLGQRFAYTPSTEEETVIIRGQTVLNWQPQNIFSRQIPWVEGYGVSAEIASDGNAGGLDYMTGGTAFGLERNIGTNILIGAVGGYSQTAVQFDRQTDWSKINSAQAGIYMQYDDVFGYLTGIATYGYNDYTVRRHILPLAVGYESTKGYNGNEFSFYLEKGGNYHFSIGHLQTFAALQYIQLHQNRIHENDAGFASLWIGGIQTDSFRGLLGLRATHEIQLPDYLLISLEARALWRHEFLDEARMLDARFINQPGGTFAVRGVNVDRDAAILGTGLTFCLRNGIELYGNYDLLISENQTAHAGTGGLILVW